MDLKLCYNTLKFKEGETLTQTFSRCKALMNEFINNGIKLSKLEINNGFINGLPKKWLSFCQSLRNTNYVKDSELSSLFGKLKYEENLIDSIYKNEKNKYLVSATPLSTAFFSTSIDEEEVSSDENEAIEVKALMALANEERVSIGKESASNGEWVKISIQKVHTLLEIEDNDDRKSFLYYLCIDLNDVEEQRNNLLSKHRNLIQELNTCKEQLLVSKQAKLDLLTMQHVNTKILKKNQNLRNELKELTSITETWITSSNKVNQYNSNMSITSSNKPRLSKAEDSTLPNHDTSKVPSDESQRNTTNPSVAVFDSLTTDYDSTDESSICSTPLPPLEKLAEPSSTPAKDNKKGTSASKTFSAPAGKLKNVKIEDDPPLVTVIKELNELKLQLSKNKSSYSKTHQSQQALFYKKCKRSDHRTCDHSEFMSSLKTTQHHTGQGESSSRSRPSRPVIPFPSCIHYGYKDHQSEDCVYYPICELYGSYDHDTHSHNMIISLRGGIKSKNP
ncbi:hypothetical protein Tco_0452024 [Tanacetum coccineum]